MSINNSDYFLEMRHITKTFPGVKALDDVSLNIRAGEVHAILGENGAGKSTLMKVLSGVYQPDAGDIMMQGQSESFSSARDAEAAGIAIIYQELNLIPDMTVAENIFLGREPQTRFGLVDFARMKKEAAAELERVGAVVSVDAEVGELRIGQQQLVEIAKALSLNAGVLIMDEPTSALSDAEVDQLFQVVRTLQKSGVAIFYISHKMDEIFALANRVSVLRDGEYIGTRNVVDVKAATLINMMVGRDLQDIYPKQKASVGAELLRVSGLTVANSVRNNRDLLADISFFLNAGEVLGIAGLMGAGRTELMLSLFGVAPGEVLSGDIFISGKKLQSVSPNVCIKNGMALVTESRRQSFFLDLPVKTNTSIASLSRFSRMGMLNRKAEEKQVREYTDQLRVKAPHLSTAVNTLSGGNQQKVILARWLMTHPKILLLDDPTRGIDVGAKEEIYQLMNQFTADGMGIILVSSELPELMAMSDRLLVLSEGRVTAAFSAAEATEQKIMAAATNQLN